MGAPLREGMDMGVPVGGRLYVETIELTLMDDWRLVARLRNPQPTHTGFEDPTLRKTLTVDEINQSRKDTRAEFVRRGYTESECNRILSGDELIVSKHQRTHTRQD